MNKISCPDQECLMAVALGEPAEPGVATHLEECTLCKHQVDRLRFMVVSLRKTVSGGQLAETTPFRTTTEQAAVQERPAALGKYLVVGELGRGGQALVYRALHPTLGRDVAIKWSRKDLDHLGAARLSQEGKLLADLDHPNIVRVFDLDVHDGRPFLVMEYIRGCDLEQYAGREKLTPRQSAAIVAQLARALAVAHARNIIHQDIKPSNVLIDEAGRPRLSDFGIARIRDLWNGTDSQQPMGGTIGYMAPEQLGQPDKVCQASDLFALGGVLFFLLTGRGPRQEMANPALAYEQVAKGQIDFAPLENKKVPRQLADICRKALAGDIAKRYQKAEDLAADLESYGQKQYWHGGMLLAACLAGVLLLWGAFTFLRPQTPTGNLASNVAFAAADAVAGTFIIDLRRNGVRDVLKTRGELEKKLPIQASDRLRIAGHAPETLKLGLFRITLTDAQPKIEELGPLETNHGRFELKKLVPFSGTTATDVLFVCGSDQAPTQQEVETALLGDGLPGPSVSTPRATKTPNLLLPRNILIAFQSDKVQSVTLGHVEDDPVQLVAEKLEVIREKLRKKFDFVAGFAFTHYPDSAEVLAQVGNPADDPRNKDHRVRIEGGPEEDQKLFQEVMDRLLQTTLVRDTFPPEYAFPPKCIIKPNSAKEFNAYAAHRPNRDASGKFPTEVLITQGYLNRIVKGDRDILAAIMGHELTHLIKRHPVYYNQKELLFRAFSRDQEIEADLEGVKIALAANFSWESGIRAAFREWKELGGNSNFEGLTATHPSWEERLNFLDRKRAELWKSMAAFQNGYFFLHAEQYASAAECFAAVTKEFPDCAEAWANLGYAKLMMYCDGLEEKDLRAMKIGQFVAGCFYPRPKDIFVPRNVDDTMWKEAVVALNKAKSIDENLVLVRANLGLAYLVHPDFKDAEARKNSLDVAEQHFRSAQGIKDKGLTGLSLAAFLINYGVAEQAQGKFEAAADKYRLARTVLPAVKGFSSLPSALNQALIFNEALMEETRESAKGQAFSNLTTYLRIAPTTSIWWGLAYDHYEKLGKEIGRETLSKDVLSRRFQPDMPRLQTSAQVEPGKLIILSADRDKTLKLLGREHAVGVPVVPAKVAVVGAMKRYFNAAPGVDLLANNKILAIYLTNPAAPPVIVQAEGLGSAKKELRVGMTARDFDAVMKDEPSERRYVDNAAIEFQFFPRLGMGVRFNGNQVGEIVLAQVPRKQL